MSALFNLSGKNAIVTGSSRGIGQAAAVALAEAGAFVLLVYRRGSGRGGGDQLVLMSVSCFNAEFSRSGILPAN